MPDELVLTVQAPFASDSWTETATEPQQQPEPAQTPATEPAAQPETPAQPNEPTTPPVEQKNEEPAIDVSEYIKSTYGYDNEDLLKQDIQELGTLREFRKQYTEFSDAESKRIYELLKEGKRSEVLSFLDSQVKIDRLLDADVNIQTAEDILKLQMQKQNPDLEQEDVDFMFNRKYSFPAKPVEKDTETPEEYEARVKDWERQIEVVQREMVIAAKQAKPELAKFKTELRLPDSEQKQEAPTGPTQEELQKQAEAKKFVQERINSDYKNFTGFTAVLKNEDVETPISFMVDETERESLKDQLISGEFVPEDFLMDRWFDDKGNLNVNAIFEDVMLLKNRDSNFQKLVNEASSQTLEQRLKRQTNVSLGANQQETFKGGNTSDMEKQIAYLWQNG